MGLTLAEVCPIDSMIDCPCGHPVSLHVQDGCRAARCRCARNARDVIEVAIAAVRTEDEAPH